MIADADLITDRRRMRRKLAFWRLAAFLAVAAAILGVAHMAGQALSTPHVARITLSGVIVEDRDVLRTLRRVAEARSVRAVLVDIDSPGGTTAGAEAIYEALRRVAERKPVVARMGTLATSGGYAVALGADHIVARHTTITGSIGVLVQWANVSELLDSLGINVESVKSGPLKAQPSPFEPTGEAAREAIGALITDSYDWFIGLVADRRALDDGAARRLADGRIMTGRQALDAGLVDAIGGEEAARRWLADTHGIDADLPLRDWGADGLPGFGGGRTGWMARALGLEGVARTIDRTLAGSGALDGLVSVWHPQVFEE